MTTIVSLRLAESPAEIAASHRAYAARHGYALAEHCALHIRGERMRLSWKYHLLAHHLRRAGEGEVVVLLTDETVVLGDEPIEVLLGAADAFVAGRLDAPELPNLAAIVLRRGPGVLALIDALLARVALWLDCTSELSREVEAVALAPILAAFGLRLWPTLEALPGGLVPHVHVNTRGHSALALGGRTVLLVSEPEFLIAVDGQWRQSPLNDWHVLAHLARGTYRAAPEPAPPAAEPSLHHNPRARVGLVSLHTPNIRDYAALHETNLLAYAQRHGHALHSYRTLPDFLPAGIGPSWSKSFLLRHHLDEHELVAWIDADALIARPELDLAQTAEGLDFLAARDHAYYHFNSGFMVLRRTPVVLATLDAINAAILAAGVDPADVYAAGGDQTFFNHVAARFGLVTPEAIHDSVSFNARPPFAAPTSFLVHFSEYLGGTRAPAMAAWLAAAAPQSAPAPRPPRARKRQP